MTMRKGRGEYHVIPERETGVMHLHVKELPPSPEARRGA